jgi:SAM-dependent methyltransferase
VPSPSYEVARCVVCGHTDSVVVAEADDIRAEVELLWEYHERRLRPETPASRLMDRVAFSEPPPLRLVRCNECGLLYRNPVERPRELTEMYARSTSTLDVLRALHDTQLRASRVQARELRRALGRPGTGLEVGSYVGAFLDAARGEGLQVEGLDINADANAFTRSMGFTAHDGELTSFTTDRTFDAVAIWNTFDQLADPRGAVHAAHRLIRSGGVLALRVPNGAFYAAVRRMLMRGSRVGRAVARAVLAQNNLLTFPYRWGFTPRALSRLLSEHGFVVERIRGDVLVPIADEWTRPWARVEETLIKRAIRAVAGFDVGRAPWFEVFGRRGTGDGG